MEHHNKNICAFGDHRILGRHRQKSTIFFFWGERNREVQVKKEKK